MKKKPITYVLYWTTIIFVGILMLYHSLTFFVNIISIIKLALYYISHPNSWLNFSFYIGSFIWASLAFVSVFIPILIFSNILKIFWSEGYSTIKKAGLILVLVILMPVLSIGADIGQVLVITKSLDVDDRLNIVSGIQENYSEALLRGEVIIIELWTGREINPVELQNIIDKTKIENIFRYLNDDEEQAVFASCNTNSWEGFRSCVFDEISFINPASSQTAGEWVENGNTFGKLGEYDKAIEAYNKAIAIDPNYKEAWYNKGLVS